MVLNFRLSENGFWPEKVVKFPIVGWFGEKGWRGSVWEHRNKDRKMIASVKVVDHCPLYFRRYVCSGKREVYMCKCVVSGIVCWRLLV